MQAPPSTRRTSPADAVGGEQITADICVIGAGAGGMAVALQAAAFGRSVILVEKNKMGGGSLNTACVPSKALIAAAKRAEAFRTAGVFGVRPLEPDIDLRAVAAHVRGVITTMQPTTSVERLQALGIRVILGAARFLDKRTLLAGDYRVTARRFVIATGSSAAIPPIPGLSNIPYFTNETIFDNERKLAHLVIVGGGPIGMELAQAYRRLGSKVTLIESGRVLSRDDPEFATLAADALRAEGVDIRENTMIEGVDGTFGVRLTLRTERGLEVVDGTHILVAAGRRANVSDLNLDVAGVKHDQRGIAVSAGLKTTNSRVYAIGDVTGNTQHTHAATYHADLVVRNILFRIPAKVDTSIIPWVTYTEPELAHVGLSEGDAIRRNITVRALRWSFHENDRARAEHSTQGHIKVLTDKKGRVLGATIAGPTAGELIQIWSLAVKERMHIGKLATMIAPYPTFGEAGRKAALSFYSSVPAAPLVRKIIDLFAKLG